MKKLFVMLVLCLTVLITVQAQKKVALDSLGNYTTVKALGVTTKDAETGKFFIDSKGVKYPVRESVNGNLYYLKTAKSGNIYKVYLKTK